MVRWGRSAVAGAVSDSSGPAAAGDGSGSSGPTTAGVASSSSAPAVAVARRPMLGTPIRGAGCTLLEIGAAAAIARPSAVPVALSPGTASHPSSVVPPWRRLQLHRAAAVVSSRSHPRWLLAAAPCQSTVSSVRRRCQFLPVASGADLCRASSCSSSPATFPATCTGCPGMRCSCQSAMNLALAASHPTAMSGRNPRRRMAGPAPWATSWWPDRPALGGNTGLRWEPAHPRWRSCGDRYRRRRGSTLRSQRRPLANISV